MREAERGENEECSMRERERAKVAKERGGVERAQ